MDFFEQMEARIPHGEVRTRFAPSPTGYMHVGNLRTALYTWLIARRHHGKFILRIEDTDQEREVPGAVDLIYKSMRQAGLTYDEGPDVGGEYGPYIQTQRRDLYPKYAWELVEKGGAYCCFCTKEEIEADRKAAEVLIVSRTGTLNYQNVYDHTDAAIIVNTTPVGMFPHNGESPIDLAKFPKLCGAVDVIYNPLRTAFISQTLSREIPAVSGLSMLVAQAVAAHEYFFDKPFANRTQVIEDILRQCTARVCNLVLVGMPGSGKTTVGKKIAALTGLPFYDADDVFAETFGKTPETVINEDGEAVFRGMETGVLKELTKRSGCIIATGGGAVKKAENRVLLKQNGYVAYIERDVEKLATDGRPLSAGGAERLKKLFEERDGLYKAVADRSFPIRENPEACAKDMIEAFGFSLLNEKTEGRE